MSKNPNKPKKGRKSKYDTIIKPRLDEITEMLKIGATDKEIAENLDISPQTFCEYKKLYPEFNEFIIKGRKRPITQIKAALYNRAVGYDYQEITVNTDSEGNETTTIKTRHLPADPACAMILLKHWDKDPKTGAAKWTNDPASFELRKRELELKEKEIEKNNW